MRLVAVNDDPYEGFAYNVWDCFEDGVVAVQHVWANSRTVWVLPATEIIE